MAGAAPRSAGGSGSRAALVSSEMIVAFGRMFGNLPLTRASAAELNNSTNAGNAIASISDDAHACLSRPIA